MNFPLPTPPRDPLAPMRRVFPGPQHIEPAFSLSELRDFPFVNVPIHDAVLTDAQSPLAEPVAESAWSAASVALVAVRQMRTVAAALDAIDRDETLSPLGRLHRGVPVLDAARVAINKELRRVADAGEMRRKLTQRAAAPTNGPSPETAREVRAVVASMPTEDRDGFLLGVGARAVDGDTDARETLLAVLSAPAAWREVHLSTAFRASATTMLTALQPDVGHALAWLQWAVELGEAAACDGGMWLDARRAALGAPPENATVILPDNGR